MSSTLWRTVSAANAAACRPGCTRASCHANRVPTTTRQFPNMIAAARPRPAARLIAWRSTDDKVRSPQRFYALTRHQFVRVLPAGQRANPLGPRVDIGMAVGPIIAVLLGRIVDVACDRKVGDGRPVASNELRARKVPVDDGCGGTETVLHESEHVRIGCLR